MRVKTKEAPDPTRPGSPELPSGEPGGHGALAVLLGLALAVRLVRLGAESLWFDEAFSIT